MYKSINFTPTAADANGICQSQTPGGAGSLTLNGALVSSGVATLNTDEAGQLVEITSVADETSRTFTITGTDGNGNTLTEVITGANAGTATGTKYFKTVTDVAVDAATTGAVEAGNSVLTASKWVPVNWREKDFKVSLMVTLGDTATYSVEHTLNNILANGTDVTNRLDNDGMSALTASDDGNYFFPVNGVRCYLSAYTSGDVTFEVRQAH